MGFFDVLSGSGGLDVSGAERLAEDMKNLYAKKMVQFDKDNAPYTTVGRASADELMRRMGLTPKMDSTYYRQFVPTSAQQVPSGQYYESGKAIYEARDDGLYKQDWDGPYTAVGDFYRMDTPDMQVDTTAPEYGSLLDPFTQDDFQESPNFQFVREQGEKTLDRKAAAKGNYFSPAAMQELLGYNTGLASNEWLNAFNMDDMNKRRTFDMLMGTTGVGQTAQGQQMQNDQTSMSAINDLSGQLAQLGLASQADKQSRRQSAFNNLMKVGTTVAGMAGGVPMGGAGGSHSFNNLAQMMTASVR